MASRGRGIVRGAAALIKDSATRSWVLEDRYGSFEKDAAALLAQTQDRAVALGLTPEQVDEQVAVRLAYVALQTVSDYLHRHPTTL